MIVNDRIEDFINSLDVSLPEYLRIIEKEARADYVPIVKKPTQNLLKFLISYSKPKNILEVGTAIGFSSLLMSEYMPQDCHITTIEKMKKRVEIATKNIKDNNKDDKITILEGDAIEVLENIDETFDIIFLDAAKGQYINFLDRIMSLLNPGGLLISDNVLQDGDVAESRYGINRRNRTIHYRMREYLYVITHDERLKTVVLPVGDGVTLSTKVVTVNE